MALAKPSVAPYLLRRGVVTSQESLKGRCEKEKPRLEGKAELAGRVWQRVCPPPGKNAIDNNRLCLVVGAVGTGWRGEGWA